jgi:hypothetical protein
MRTRPGIVCRRLLRSVSQSRRSVLDFSMAVFRLCCLLICFFVFFSAPAVDVWSSAGCEMLSVWLVGNQRCGCPEARWRPLLACAISAVVPAGVQCASVPSVLSPLSTANPPAL